MNPGAMNPVKFHEIQEKRKLLWGSKKKEVLGRGGGAKRLHVGDGERAVISDGLGQARNVVA